MYLKVFYLLFGWHETSNMHADTNINKLPFSIKETMVKEMGE